VTAALNAQCAAGDRALRPNRVGPNDDSTLGEAGELRRVEGRRGKVGADRLPAAELLVRDRHPNGLSAFDGDLVVRRVAEPRHRELLTRTKLDVEVPTLARRADRPVAAGRRSSRNGVERRTQLEDPRLRPMLRPFGSGAVLVGCETVDQQGDLVVLLNDELLELRDP
jgi:hypothetical protein